MEVPSPFGISVRSIIAQNVINLRLGKTRRKLAVSGYIDDPHRTSVAAKLVDAVPIAVSIGLCTERAAVIGSVFLLCVFS